MASNRLVQWAALVNAGVAEGEAAKRVGYAEATARTKLAGMRDAARAAGLFLTLEEARAPLELIKAAVSPEDWTAIATKAAEQAKAGDPVARAWLADRLIGKVAQGVEHGGSIGLWLGFDPEIDEREHRNDQPDIPEG